MIYLYTCNGYKIIRELPFDFPRKKLPSLCEKLEQERNDGYSVFASSNGHILSFSDGLC